MDLFYKHYEKLILVVCLILMIVGLLKVSQTVSEANADRKHDINTKANYLDPAQGDMAPDFNPKLFESKEAWIQRIKDNRPAPVTSIAEVLSSPRESTDEDIKRNWDRRYFTVLTRHSRKPIEETEAKYKLEKNTKSLATLKDNVRQVEEAIRKRIAQSGDNEDDTRLAELKMQLEGYQVLLANTEMDIVEISKRIKYISMFCTPQGSLVDPHEVICCPNPNCGSLLLSKDDFCPFCGTKMPLINPAEDAGKDSDGDGLPDEFEMAHAQKRGFLKPVLKGNGDGMDGGAMGDRGGAREASQPGALDPLNPNDAYEDFDNDFSSNLEEYCFSTDIDDERDFPAPANFVRIDKFERDKLPFKLMGINDGRVGKDQKVAKWRARFSFMRKIRGREVWERNEDNYEQVKIGKKFETPDGKEFILEDLDEEEVNGEKRAVAIVKEFIRPVKQPKRPPKPGEAPAEPAPEQREAKSYTIHQDQDAYYDTTYAYLIYFVSRNLSMMDSIYNYGRFVLQSGAKSYRIQTRFKLEEGAIVKLVVPVLKRENTPAAQQEAPQKQGRFNRLRNGGDMERGGGEMERGGGMTSQEYELREFQYKLTKFNAEAKTLTLVPLDAKEANLAFTVKAFDEEEMVELPNKVKVPFFYEGRSMEGFGGGERGGMMEGGERGGRPMPEDMRRRGGPRR